MLKKYFVPIFLIAGLLVLFAALRWSGRSPEAAANVSAATGSSLEPSAPSTPFDASAFTPGEKVSAASIARLKTRAEELREARSQLSVKMQSIDKRLADAAKDPNAASLREAKRALETSMEKMEAEERALAEFLLNEQKGQGANP